LAPSSSSSSPSCPFPLHLPTLLVSFEAQPISLETLSTSLEVLSVFSEALSHVFIVFSFFNNCIAQSSIVNPPFIGINDGSYPRICILCYILGIFRFDFFKIRYMHFRKSSPFTRPSTLVLGVTASICHQNYPHTP
jgi:hypothetical protein